MNRYALLALDVDGTLVGETGLISARLRRALDELRTRGLHICLCTGRPLAATRRYLDELSLNTPPVVLNGALVPSLDGGAPLVQHTLTPEAVARLVTEAQAYGDYLELHTATDLYIERLGYEAEYQRDKLGVTPRVGPFERLWEREPIYKAQFVIRTEAQRQRLHNLAGHLAGQADLSWGVSPGFDGHFINVMRPGVEKSASLDTLLRALDISWDQVFAAGDSPSDLAYVCRAGCGVIMGNAPQAVRDRAPRIAPPVQEDGLAQALESLVLNA